MLSKHLVHTLLPCFLRRRARSCLTGTPRRRTPGSVCPPTWSRCGGRRACLQASGLHTGRHCSSLSY